LISVLEQSLRLLHPFMPYLTEELWQKLPVEHALLLHRAYAGAEPTIMLASFPLCDDALVDERAESEMQAVIDLVSRVRNIRSEINIKPGERIQLMIAANADLQAVFRASSDQIARLTRAANISIDGNAAMPKASARAVLTGGAEVAVPLEGLIDFAQERERLLREKEKLQKEREKLDAQLGNQDFVQRAPAEKVAGLRARLAEIAQQTAALDQMVEALS
jgi:valyl-tRNA synthetase